jgi:hypothetical protein
VSPKEIVAGEVSKEDVLKCVKNYEGNWGEYVWDNDWYNFDSFYHEYGVRDVASHVKFPDGTFEELSIQNFDSSEAEEPILGDYIQKDDTTFVCESESIGIATKGWDDWKTYSIKLEYGFDSSKVIPIFSDGICNEYEYNDEDSPTYFTDNDDFTTRGKGFSSQIYYVSNGKLLNVDLERIASDLEKNSSLEDEEIIKMIEERALKGDE